MIVCWRKCHPPTPPSFMTTVLNTKPVCCYEKRSKVGRNSLEETILHPCVESSAHVRSPPRLSCSEENPVQAASNQPVPAYQWAGSAQAPHSSVSAAERRGTATAAPSISPGMRLSQLRPDFLAARCILLLSLIYREGSPLWPRVGGVSCYSDSSCFNDGAHVASPRSFGKHVSKEAPR